MKAVLVAQALLVAVLVSAQPRYEQSLRFENKAANASSDPRVRLEEDIVYGQHQLKAVSIFRTRKQRAEAQAALSEANEAPVKVFG